MTPYYEEDGITIYHGDCRDVLPALVAASCDLAFADPPYGVGFGYGDAYTDSGGEGYAAWMGWTATELQRIASTVLVTPGIANIWTWPAATWVLCWSKPGSTRRSMLPQPNRPQGGFNEWEPILVYGRPTFMHDSIRVVANPQKDTGDHPCPKPLRLLRWLVEGASHEGGIVLDPFAGSGTTLRAAKDCGRRAIGIELEERYCEIAARRLAQGVLFGAAS